MPDRITYKVSCLTAESKAVAFITSDRTNHTVHIHFFGEMFGKKRTPIQVIRADTKFPEGNNDKIIRDVIKHYGPIAGLQIRSISKVKGNGEAAMTGTPVRIIVRFKK